MVKKGEKKGGGEGEEKEKKMEEISLNGGEGFQEASWGVGNVFKKFEEYTPLVQCSQVGTGPSPTPTRPRKFRKVGNRLGDEVQCLQMLCDDSRQRQHQLIHV